MAVDVTYDAGPRQYTQTYPEAIKAGVQEGFLVVLDRKGKVLAIYPDFVRVDIYGEEQQ